MAPCSIELILAITVIAALLADPVAAITYSHVEAWTMLDSAGIQVSSSGQCSNRYNAQCTSLEGIHKEVIDTVLTLKRVSGCPLAVTGGTETGHASVGARSHHNGWKVDLRKRGSDCLTGYITRNFKKISNSRWQAASGNIYLNEGNHWDVQVNT